MYSVSITWDRVILVLPVSSTRRVFARFSLDKNVRRVFLTFDSSEPTDWPETALTWQETTEMAENKPDASPDEKPRNES
jgi:hypothetical protein